MPNLFGQNSEISPDLLEALEPLSIEAKVDTLLSVFDEKVNQNPEEAQHYAQLALKTSQTHSYSSGVAVSNYKLGIVSYILTQLPAATKHLNQSLSIYQKTNDEHGITLCYKYLGSVERGMRNYDESMNYYSQALRLAEKISYEEEIPKITQNIAAIFLDQKHYAKAIEYFQKSLTKINSPYDQSVCLTNLGMTYQSIDSIDLALQYYEQSILLCKQINNSACSLYPLQQIATIHLQLDNYEKALEYSLEILRTYEMTGPKEKEMVTNNHIGLIYLDQKKINRALVYFNVAKTLAEEIQSPNLPFIHANISLAYEETNNYQSALSHLWTFQHMKDSLFDAQRNMQTEEMLAKFDSERKEQAIELLQKEKDLQTSELRRQAILRNAAISGAILSLISTFVFWFIYNQKIKIQKELTIKAKEINKQKTRELIRENEITAIKANIEGQEKERKRIAQELHDGIAGSLASIKLNLSVIDKSSKEPTSLKPTIDNIDKTYQEVRAISHYLMPPQFKDLSFIELISNYLLEVSDMNTFDLSFNFHPKNEELNLFKNVSNELYRVIQEIMTNIHKHAKAKNVSVQLTKVDESLNIMIEDDGVGYDTKAPSNGIGLLNMSSRINTIEGKLNIDTALGHGTTINIDIPLKEIIDTHQK